MNGMRAKGYYDNLELVQSRETDDATLDILVKTKIKVGRFYNTGPPGIEEVVQEDLKNIFKPGRLEKKWIKILSKDFGRRTKCSVLRIITFHSQGSLQPNSSVFSLWTQMMNTRCPLNLLIL